MFGKWEAVTLKVVFSDFKKKLFCIDFKNDFFLRFILYV